MNDVKLEEIDDLVYWGLFIEDAPKPSLEKAIEYPHITFGYKKPCPVELLGKEYDIFMYSYGNDGINEAYRASIPIVLQKYYRGVFPIHVTISTHKNALPVWSSVLNFDKFIPLPKNAKYKARLGYFGTDGMLHFSLE